eukprot:5107581-Pyramimonas_sp.AAC.1
MTLSALEKAAAEDIAAVKAHMPKSGSDDSAGAEEQDRTKSVSADSNAKPLAPVFSTASKGVTFIGSMLFSR